MRNFGHVEDGHVGSLGDLQLWIRILKLSRSYTFPLTAAVILSLLVTASSLSLPYLLQQGIDNWLMSDGISQQDRFNGLAITSFYYLLLVGVVFLTSFIQILLLEWIGQSIMHIMRQKLFRHICSLDLTFLNSQPTGRLVTRITNDIQNMHEMFTSVMVTLFNDSLRIIGILFLLFLMNRKLAFLMLLFVPIAAGLTIVFSKLAREKFSAIRAQLAIMNGYLQETISSMSIIWLFNRQQTAKNTFFAMSQEHLRRCHAQIKLFGTFMPITEMLGSIAIAVILWFGGLQVLDSHLTLGELTAFLAYMRLFFQPLRELSQKYSIVQSAMASADRIFALLDRKNSIIDGQEDHASSSLHGELSVKQINFSYNKNEPIIKNLSLNVPAGKTVAIIGTTGAGKSTLINLLLRFYEPQSGQILLDNIPINDLKLKDLRNYIGVILQDIYILQDTLLANIVMDTDMQKEQVNNILEISGMTRFIKRLPKGLDTLIGEGGHELSTGEKQLLAFARLLCRSPKLLVLDEATAAVDAESETILEEALEKGFGKTSSIIIAHRLATIQRADLIGVMEKGTIIEFGTHDELMKKKGAYASFVQQDQADNNLNINNKKIS